MTVYRKRERENRGSLYIGGATDPDRSVALRQESRVRSREVTGPGGGFKTFDVAPRRYMGEQADAIPGLGELAPGEWAVQDNRPPPLARGEQDLNQNGIPDGAEVTTRTMQTDQDGTQRVTTAKWRHRGQAAAGALQQGRPATARDIMGVRSGVLETSDTQRTWLDQKRRIAGPHVPGMSREEVRRRIMEDRAQTERGQIRTHERGMNRDQYVVPELVRERSAGNVAGIEAGQARDVAGIQAGQALDVATQERLGRENVAEIEAQATRYGWNVQRDMQTERLEQKPQIVQDQAGNQVLAHPSGTMMRLGGRKGNMTELKDEDGALQGWMIEQPSGEIDIVTRRQAVAAPGGANGMSPFGAQDPLGLGR